MDSSSPLIALTRDVSPDVGRCELTHLERVVIDVDLARRQHAAYEAILEELGCRVERLVATPDLPDSVFVEDTAVVLDEFAVVTRPGATSRRAETESMADVLGRHRTLVEIPSPATLDGGDVLRIGRTLLVGVSGRTDPKGVEALARAVEPWGYETRAARVTGCLHLKSAVTEVADGVLLLNPDWVDRSELGDLEFIEVDPAEPFAANALRVGQHVVHVHEAALFRQ